MEEKTTKLDFDLLVKKQQSKKKTIFISKLVGIGFVFVMLIIYFACPISHVMNLTINGNIYYTKENIISLAGLKNYDSLYFISKKDIKYNLEKTYFIEKNSVEVKVNPFGLTINLEEIAPVFKYNDTSYLSNGEELDSSIFANENELIGEFARVNSLNDIEILSNPKDSSFPNIKYSCLAKSVLKLGLVDRKIIKFVDYDSTSYLYNFYYELGGANLLRFSIFDNPNLSTPANISNVLTSDLIEDYKALTKSEAVLDDGKPLKDHFVPFTETIDEINYTVYGEKLIFEKNDNGKIVNHVKYFNPTEG